MGFNSAFKGLKHQGAEVYLHSFLTTVFFNVFHHEVFNTYINIQCCVSQTQQNFIVFIIVLGRHVSSLIESS